MFHVFNVIDSCSVAIVLSKGDSGHPWHVPLVNEKHEENKELILTHACGDEYRILI